MTDIFATIFVHPLTLVGWQRMALLLPLCLSVSIVYKTTRCATIREIPMASFWLWITIIVGMYLVGAGLFVAYQLLS